MYSSFLKNWSSLFLICVLAITSISNAQEVRVIDNKGTINIVRNNQVTQGTEPTDPLENDVWFDNAIPENIITKIYTDSGAWEIVGGVSTDTDNALSTGTDNGAYKALKVIDVYNGNTLQEIDGTPIQLILDKERLNIGFSNANIAGNNIVVIPEDGIYKVTYTASFRTKLNDGARSTARVYLQIGSSIEPGTDSYSYHRQNDGRTNNASNVSTSTAGRSIIRSFNENEEISLHAIRFEGPQNREFETLEEGTGITVHKLD